MGGSSEKKTTSSEQRDPWAPAQPALQTALGGAMDAYNKTYQGPQVAGMDPNVTAGQNAVLSNAQGGMTSRLAGQTMGNFGDLLSRGGLTQQQTDALGGLGSSLGQFNKTVGDAQSYLNPYANGSMLKSNPYLDSTINASMNDAAGKINSQFSGAGRYGSGAQSDVLSRNLGNIATSARMADYNQQQQNQLGAIGQMGSLANMGLQGNIGGQGAMSALSQQGVANMGAIGGMLPGLHQAANMDAADQMNIGGQRMDYQQRLIDSANQAPWQRVGNLAQIAGGIGGLGGTASGQSTTTQSGGSPWGTALAGLGTFGNLFSAGAGGTSAAAGLGSAFSSLAPFMAFSDERLKENIAPVGNLDDGQKIYAYNYKGDDTPQIGLLAQEVEKTHPEAVFEHPSGFKMVHYGLATAAARKKRAA